MAYLISQNQQTILKVYKQMYANKWIDESGGGVAIRKDNDVYAVPSATEYLKFGASVANVGRQDYIGFKTDICAGLLRFPFEKLNANAILHTHSTNAIVVADWNGVDRETITWSGLNPINCIFNRELGGYVERGDTVILPIINDVEDLEGKMTEVCDRFRATSAVLVRGHGFFVWDSTLEGAFEQCKAYEKLFEMDVKRGWAQFDAKHPRQ